MTQPTYLQPEQGLSPKDLADALECQQGIKKMKEWTGFPDITNIEFMIWFKHWFEAGRALVPYPESLRHVDATLAEVQRGRSTPQADAADTDPNEPLSAIAALTAQRMLETR